jgi:hypothetical protein
MWDKSPLQATTVKVTEKAGYKVENVMFCSRPDFWVTGDLYVPTSGSGSFAPFSISTLERNMS